MNVCKIVLTITALMTLAGGESGFALEKPIVCMTLGTSNSGVTYGIRIRSENGKLVALIDKVTLFHNVLVAYSDKPLKTVDVQFNIRGCGGFLSYTGDDFHFYTDGYGYEDHDERMGYLKTIVNGEQVESTAIPAMINNSDYCN